MNEAIRKSMGLQQCPMSPEEEQRLRDVGRKIVGKLFIHRVPPNRVGAHGFLVKQLVENGAKIRGFKIRLEELFGERTDEGVADFDWIVNVPDAWTATEDEVCIYEVDITSPSSLSKIDNYSAIWSILDSIEVICRLFVVDARGGIREVDLADHFFRKALAEGDQQGGA